MPKSSVMLSESSWVEQADVLDPKAELLRLPSKFEQVYTEAEACFDRYYGEGVINAKNYGEVVEAMTTSTIMGNDLMLGAGLEEENRMWERVNFALMSYAGRKFPNT